jgi:hypothetical protein
MSDENKSIIDKEKLKKTVEDNKNLIILFMGMLIPIIVIIVFVTLGNKLGDDEDGYGSRGLSEKHYFSLAIFSVIFFCLGLFGGGWLEDLADGGEGGEGGSPSLGYFLRFVWLVSGGFGIYFAFKGIYLDGDSAVVSSCISYVRDVDELDKTASGYKARCENVGCLSGSVADTEWENWTVPETPTPTPTPTA